VTAGAAQRFQAGPFGTAFLVVGPSGVGKDSLIRAAWQRLSDSSSFHFPRRVVTRPADPDSEDFESVTMAEFERRRAAGEFWLDWSAHGLCYGVPASAGAALAAGRSIVVNVSRTVIAAAGERFPSVRVIQVTAPPDVLERRLADRSRASDGDLGARLARHVSLPPGATIDAATVVNDSTLEKATTAFMAILLAGEQRAR